MFSAFGIFTGVAAIVQYQSFAMNSFDAVQVVFEHFPNLLSLTLELAHQLLTPIWFLCQKHCCLKNLMNKVFNDFARLRALLQ
jgi:hypothetical protein